MEVRQEFQQKGFEFLVRAVNLIDQQDGRIGRAQRRHHRPLDQERLAVNIDALVARLTDRQHLPGIVPLVERGGGVDPLVALQADETARQHRGDRLSGFRLADSRRAFEEEGLAQRQREIGGGRESLVCEIIGGAQRLFERRRTVDSDNIAPDRHCVPQRRA